MSSLGEGWKRPGDPADSEPKPQASRTAIRLERERDPAAEQRRAKRVRRAKLAWIFGWPPLFVTAFVVSSQLHDSSAEVPETLNLDLTSGVTAGEFVAFLVGAGGVIVWIVGCLVLAFQES